MSIEKLTKRLQGSIDFALDNEEDLDVASWDYQEGILITANEAKLLLDLVKNCSIPVVMPCILHFVDENGNNVDLNAAGVNAKLLRDGTFEYFISYGFAGRKELTPVYGA